MRRKLIPALQVLLFATLWLFICNTPIKAQVNNFRQWSVENGLAQSNVYCIKQDHRGYLWIGTESGLCLFDGKTFRTFTVKEGLCDNAVRSLMVDSKGWIWIGTGAGISIYDGYRFTNITRKEGFSGKTALCFLETPDKSIWVGTDDGGLNQIRLSGSGVEHIQTYAKEFDFEGSSIFDLYLDESHRIWASTLDGIKIITTNDKIQAVKVLRTKSGLPVDQIKRIVRGDKDELWVATLTGGLFKMKVSRAVEDTSRIISFTSNNRLSSNSIFDILFSNQGELWAGNTYQGLDRITPTLNSKGNKIQTFGKSQGMANDGILSLFQDEEGNIWIGTNGHGLYMSPGDYFSHFNEKNGLGNTIVQGIAQDSSGKFWLATAGGLYEMNYHSDEAVSFHSFQDKELAGNNSITAIAVGNNMNHNLWLGTSFKGIIRYDGKRFQNFDENNGLVDNRVNCLYVDTKGIVWCGTANGISRFDGVRFLSFSTKGLKMEEEGIKSIIEDKKGNIWFATAGGLARYDGTGKLRTFDAKEGLKYIDVNVLCEGPDACIWIGTNGGGLYKYDPKKPDTIAISHLPFDNAISALSIHGLVFKDEHTLMVATYNGFDKLWLNNQGKVLRFKNYNNSDGFIGIECNNNAIYKDKKDNIWFGTIKGLTKYTGSLERLSHNPPKVHLNAIQLFNKEVNWLNWTDSILPWYGLPQELQLPYTQNNITFQFDAISFNNPEKVQYKFLLIGRDKDWSPPKKIAEANFSGLTHGTYVFEVMAVDANGRWSEPEIFQFTIMPAWYQTIWFYIFIVVLLVFLTYSYIRFRESRLVSEKLALENIVTERTKEIVLQKEHIAEKNKEITDSINYAKRIQNAILPELSILTASVPESFVLFNPKDIVSGDFYWFYNRPANPSLGKAGDIYVAAADCTGHGVPGAFMSTIGVEKLNEAIKFESSPDAILSYINRSIKHSLQQLDELPGQDMSTAAAAQTHIRDGMDIGLIKINYNEKGNVTMDPYTATINYAAANRPLWIIRKGSTEMEEIRPTKSAIGGFTMTSQHYDNHTFHLQKGDSLYLFSDGYPDQFGHNNKKFMTKRFKTLLISIQDQPMDKQKDILHAQFLDWKGDEEQTDDVLVIGIRI